MKQAHSHIVPSGFFLMRTPLLPLERLLTWGEGLVSRKTPLSAGLRDALEADRVLLRSRLREYVASPILREALFLASTDFEVAVTRWAEEKSVDAQLEGALTRYFLRAVGRATPFGLFGVVSIGKVDRDTSLQVPSESEWFRRTRLDSGYLTALCEAASSIPQVMAEMRFRANSSLYALAGQWRYVAYSTNAHRAREYRLAAIDDSGFVAAALERCSAGATRQELIDAITVLDVEEEEAALFIEELVDSQILVSELQLPLTGEDLVRDCASRLAEYSSLLPYSRALVAADEACRAADAGGIGIPHSRYTSIENKLSVLPVQLNQASLFQVDLFGNSRDLRIGSDVITEIASAIDMLHSLNAMAPALTGMRASLQTFATQFADRYGDREVKLSVALDEENGLRWPPGASDGTDAIPLLDGVSLPDNTSDVPSKTPNALTKRVLDACSKGEWNVNLGLSDIASIKAEDRTPLSTSFAVFARLAASSLEALDAGVFQVFVKFAHGPPGAVWISRFCHGHPQLTALIRDLVVREERNSPDQVFAEIVHLPHGRSGNYIARPTLRSYEIPYLGESGLPRDRQLQVCDLRLSVRDGRLVLRSESLNQCVVPRLSSAHDPSAGFNLALYRFLHALQFQDTADLILDLSSFRELTDIPRISCGRAILSLRTWVVNATEAASLQSGEEAFRYDAVQKWRHARGIDRYVVYPEADNELLLDLENPYCVDALIRLLKKYGRGVIIEMFPAIDSTPASSPHGHYMNELIIPFSSVTPSRSGHKTEPAPSVAVRSSPRRRSSEGRVPRSFAPGSEWLYVKIYTGTSTADRLLTTVVEPVFKRLLRSHEARNAFFIRYADPDFHLRVRIAGEPSYLAAEVLPMMRTELQPYLDTEAIWKVQLDTYEREVERYGGKLGIELAEKAFHIDSMAVLKCLRALEIDSDGELRWRTAILGVKRLFDDFGISPSMQVEVLQSLRTTFSGKGSYMRSLATRNSLSAKFRKIRHELEVLLDDREDSTLPMEVREALQDRSVALHESRLALWKAAADSQIDVPPVAWIGSIVHMFVNRLLRSAPNKQEFVLYDLLLQVQRAADGRARARASLPKAVATDHV